MGSPIIYNFTLLGKMLSPSDGDAFFPDSGFLLSDPVIYPFGLNEVPFIGLSILLLTLFEND